VLVNIYGRNTDFLFVCTLSIASKNMVLKPVCGDGANTPFLDVHTKKNKIKYRFKNLHLSHFFSGVIYVP